MTQCDANYMNSGDPFEGDPIGTTPVGSYDGRIRDGFVTCPNMNGYGIHDLSGNAAEWGTGQAVGFLSRNAPCCGGDWIQSNTECGGLTYNHEALWAPSCKNKYEGLTSNRIGFRVVRSAPR